MKTYLLFLFSNFKNHEEVEFFCLDVLGVSSVVSKVRFVIEDSSKSVIIIFESESNRKELSEELHNIISMEDVKFYFLFERESIYSANLPVQLKDFMFKPLKEHTSLLLEYDKNPKNEQVSSSLDLDDILEKIEQHGIESLTPVEKKFLDDFKK
jgi:hypothetical protein